ncbi:hypothetical protein E9993_04045 [Labilibacter sediminis]|nr:hypothetical protein E9993_04045 [Labilibacter sediminis]
MRIRILFFSLIFIAVVYACTSDDSDFCLSNQQSVQSGFYSSSYSTDRDTTVSDVVIYSTGIDSITYDTATVSKTFLPLSMHNDTSEYIIEINKLKDTVSFVHTKELNFVSGECGFIFTFELDTILYSDNQIIDSVAIDYPSIVYGENIENVKIYLY